MENIELIIGTTALIIAVWALHLQRKEIIKNGRINALIRVAQMIQEKINYHDNIIEDMKKQGRKYDGHAHRINNELRPLKNKINMEFINLAAKYDGVLHENEIREALKPNKTNQ